MRAARILTLTGALELASLLVLAHSVEAAPKPAASGPGVESRKSLAATVIRSDSIRCALGAGASGSNTSRTRPVPSGGRFAPRWHSDHGVITVHLDDGKAIADWSPAYRDEVVSALSAWTVAGAPVTFSIVGENEPAAVRIHWIDRFDSRYDGWTTIRWDASGWLVGGDLTLAVHRPTGQLLTTAERDQVMLHEVGHLLGLAHSTSSTSIMRSSVKVTQIGALDRRALMSLYEPADSSEFMPPSRQSGATVDRCGDQDTDSRK